MLKPGDKIWWNEKQGTDGSMKQKTGIVVAAHKTEKTGCMAVETADYENNQQKAKTILVLRPHKIRATPEPIPFERYLAELDNPADRIRLHSLGVTV